MKAIVYNQYGPPEVLYLTELEKPVPQKDEVLIKIHAVEVTKSDCELRSFKFPVSWFWLPLRLVLGWRRPKRQILGGYFAGEIVSVGDKVNQYQVGEPIFGCANLTMGCYAEYVCLPAKYTMVTKPSNLSFAEAASVPLGGLNALHFMREANIKPGERVLVNGAGGSIGIFGVQIAKQMGAEVTVVDSSLKKDMLLNLGADRFIDYRQQDFTKNSISYDVIFDMVAGSSYSKCLNILKDNGRYLTANPTLMKMLRSIITNRFTKKRSIFALASEKEEELSSLKEMIESGKIKPVLDKVFSLEDLVEAHKLVETEQRVGCIAIHVGADD